MTSRRVAKFSLTVAILTLVVSVAGFIVTLVLNAFFLDKYDAYGEVAIPGSGSVHLPAGDVTVSLHTLVIGGTNGVGDLDQSARRCAATGGNRKYRQHNDGQQRRPRTGMDGPRSRRGHLPRHDRR